MNEKLGDYRKSYDNGVLLEGEVPVDPLSLFATWFSQADEDQAIAEPNAMTLSTVDGHGLPRNRVVLLKDYGADGFVWYSNYASAKGQDLELNPKACLSFFWPSLERQVIVQGGVSTLSRKRSTAYFHSRPRGSQIGAWVSNQSEPLESRALLEQRLLMFQKQFENKEIPLPAHWGGYELRPERIEFWQGRPNRLHDRMEYRKQVDGSWSHTRLAP